MSALSTELPLNPSKSAPPRMENLDTLRIVAMLVIICTHVIEPYLDHTYWSVTQRFGEHPPESAFSPLFKTLLSINVACRFGVPCFMMISFFIYWQQLYIKGRTWGELLLRRFKRLVPAFIVWSLFYFFVHNRVYAWTGDHPGPLGDYVLQWKNRFVWRDVFLLGRAEIHLYYLPVVMIALLLIPLLKVLWPRPVLSWGYILLTLCFWVFVFYGNALVPDSNAIAPIIHASLKFCQTFIAIPLLVFPLLGMMFAGQGGLRRFIQESPRSLWIALLIVGIALHIIETLFLLPHDFLMALAGLKIGRFITAVAVFVFFLRCPLMRDPFPRVSHHAFGLHFMHPFIILMLGLIEAKLFGPMVGNWQAYVIPILILNYILTFFITFGLCLLIGKIKRLEFLVV